VLDRKTTELRMPPMML